MAPNQKNVFVVPGDDPGVYRYIETPPGDRFVQDMTYFDTLPSRKVARPESTAVHPKSVDG